jgi:hypothetical protein
MNVCVGESEVFRQILTTSCSFPTHLYRWFNFRHIHIGHFFISTDMHSACLHYLFLGHGPFFFAVANWFSLKGPNRCDSFGVAWQESRTRHGGGSCQRAGPVGPIMCWLMTWLSSDLHLCRSSGSAGNCETFAVVYFSVPLLETLYDTCYWHTRAQPLSKLTLY